MIIQPARAHAHTHTHTHTHTHININSLSLSPSVTEDVVNLTEDQSKSLTRVCMNTCTLISVLWQTCLICCTCGLVHVLTRTHTLIVQQPE